MRLVIDTNRIIAAMLKDSVSRMIILHDMFNFYTPDYVITEINRYQNYLCEKARLSITDYNVILYTILENIELVPYSLFEKYMDEANRLMKNIDVKDSPFIAVGIAIKADGIWSEDKHLHKQNRLKVYSTKDLIDILREKE